MPETLHNGRAANVQKDLINLR